MIYLGCTTEKQKQQSTYLCKWARCSMSNASFPGCTLHTGRRTKAKDEQWWATVAAQQKSETTINLLLWAIQIPDIWMPPSKLHPAACRRTREKQKQSLATVAAQQKTKTTILHCDNLDTRHPDECLLPSCTLQNRRKQKQQLASVEAQQNTKTMTTFLCEQSGCQASIPVATYTHGRRTIEKEKQYWKKTISHCSRTATTKRIINLCQTSSPVALHMHSRRTKENWKW